tara:strand:- start:54 stop:518 length:465 start_codon:yes stop_codon:yes gene_type:complete
MDKMSEKELIEALKKTAYEIIPKYKQHGQYQMSLGSLIKALQRERTGLLVKIDAVGYPGLPHSYYGYPADLAFIPDTTPITVAQFLVVCESAIQASFVGPDNASGYYRDYTMQANTPVWISQLENASKTGITDVVPVDDYIQLVTETIEDDTDD